MTVQANVDVRIRNQRRLDRLERQFNNIGRSARRSGGSVSRFSSALPAIGAAAVIAGIAVAITKVATASIRASDALTNANNQLKAAGVASGQLVGTQARLLKLANDTRSSYTATANLYARIARSSRDLGVSQTDILDVTRAFQQTLQLSGAATSEAAAASLQFGQALASGTLQGDELRSILENNSFFAQSLAESLGVGVGQLRKLASEGQLTSEVLTRQTLKIADNINDAYSELTPTFGDAWNVFNNGAQQALGSIGRLANEAGGLTDKIQRAGQILAEEFGPGSEGFSIAKLGDLIEDGIRSIDWGQVILTTVGAAFQIIFALQGIIWTLFIEFMEGIADAWSTILTSTFTKVLDFLRNGVGSAAAGLSRNELQDRRESLESRISAEEEFATGSAGPVRAKQAQAALLGLRKELDTIVSAINDVDAITRRNRQNNADIQPIGTSDKAAAETAQSEQDAFDATNTQGRVRGGVGRRYYQDRLEELRRENELENDGSGVPGMDAFTGSGEEVVEEIKSGISSAIQTGNIGEAIHNSFTAIGSNLIDRGVSSIVDKFVGSSFNVLDDFFNEQFNNIKVDGLKNGVQSALNSLGDGVSSAFSTVSGLVKQLFSSFSSGGGGFGGILSAIGGAFGFGGGAAGGAAAAVGTARFQDGGFVPGPINQPVPAIVHGGELILNQAQQRALMGGGGTTNNNFNITATDANQIQSVILDSIDLISSEVSSNLREKRLL